MIAQQQQHRIPVRDSIILTPYPVEPGHTLLTIMRMHPDEVSKSNASYIAEGENAGIIINKPASIMDYNKIQASQRECQHPPSAKMSFKVFLINSETSKLTLEHRTLRFWLDSFGNSRQEASKLAQAYFCQLIGSSSDDFPKNYVGFIMKLMRLLKSDHFQRIVKMEVELRQLLQEEHPPSPVSSIGDGSQSGLSSPLTSQKVLDIIESSYPNPITIKEICSTTQTDATIVKQLVDELTQREKINTTDDGQHYTRTLKATTDTKIQMVRQMPKVQRSQQPVIAIITAQYCEKLAVDSMISDKETFVRYRVQAGGREDEISATASSNYVYTLGNIGDHRVVSTKLTSIGHSRGALIAAGNATTRLLGTFPEIEYVFLVGCGGGVPNYTDFSSHVRLGDIVVSHLPAASEDIPEQLQSTDNNKLQDADLSHHANRQQAMQSSKSSSLDDYVYVHCRPKLQEQQQQQGQNTKGAGLSNLPVSYSVHKNLKRLAGTGTNGSNGDAHENSTTTDAKTDDGGLAVSATNDNSKAAVTPNHSNKQLNYDECHFRLWRPAKLDLQELAQQLWLQGLDNATQRIWDYYIDEGIKTLQAQDIDAGRPPADSDKLFMSIGLNDTIEVSHPEASQDEIDLRRLGRPMCHFGPIGSGKPALSSGNEQLKQQMISQFNLRAFDSEFDPVVESIYGNCKESYIMIRGISDYKDGRKKKDWQQYSALVAAGFMKSIIVNLKPFG